MPSLKNLNIFLLMKHLSIISIVVLIIGCIYYLVSAVQVMQQILEQIDRAERLEGSSSGVPILTKQARALYEKHEKSLTIEIIVCSSTTALSVIGLMVSVREYLPLVLIYAITIKLIFIANFFVPSKMKPWILALMALVSLMSFSFAYAIRRVKFSASVDVNLPDVYYKNKNDRNDINEKNY